MESTQAAFIEFLVDSGVLCFGDFVTKSGRETPYFINTGRYRTGRQLDRLGAFYARALLEAFGDEFDNLYGPAYKGIPLAVATGMTLARDFDRDVSVTYNRKEAKEHGEKGTLIGHQYDGSERVVLIEDVVTAGTSVRESMAILAANQSPTVKGLMVSVDRMERGTGQVSAIQEIEQSLGFPVRSIVTIRDIADYLYQRPIGGRVLVDDVTRTRIDEYLATYGAQAD